MYLMTPQIPLCTVKLQVSKTHADSSLYTSGRNVALGASPFTLQSFINQIMHLMKKCNFLTLFSGTHLMLTSLFLAFFFQLQSGTAQCSLSCESLVNVSLNQNCTAEITPDVILNGSPAVSCPTGVLFVQAKINGSWYPAVGNFIANSTHIGKTLEVRVRDLQSGNSCWGNIFIEDKLAPTVICQDITVSCGVKNYAPANLAALSLTAAYPTAVDNCTGVTRSHNDVESIDVACGATINGKLNMSYAVKRVWTATDAGGMSATCVQWIYFQRVAVAAVLAPRDTVLSCGVGSYAASVTGAPCYQVGAIKYPLFPNNSFCEVNTSYQDQIIDVCSGTKKVIRTWTIMDWCAPAVAGTNPRYLIQVIKLEDKTGPVFTCPANTTISVDQGSCCATFDMPDVIVTDNCSLVKSAGGNIQRYALNGDSLGTVVIAGTVSGFAGNNLWNPDTMATYGNTACLPVGIHVITYAVTDDCGNVGTCSYRVSVRDFVEPTVVCDIKTAVSVGQDDPNDCYLPNTASCQFAGVSWVRALTFDDGSYDNCNKIKFTVQRMAPYSAFINSLNKVNGFPDCNDATADPVSEFGRATAEGDSVKFYCAEAGTTQMVILRVYQVDGAGNVMLDLNGQPIVNSCMVEVEVQDKLAPKCTAPANVTVSCESFDPTLASYGLPTVTDNCCLDATKTYLGQKGFTGYVDYSQFDTICNKGIILVSFTAYDCGGRTSVCGQRITVNYQQDYFLHLPADAIDTTCKSTATYGVPVIFDKDCELVGTSFVDDTFRIVPDACYKVIRKWKVANWCTFNADLPCVTIPNPTPHAISNHPSNLNAPVLKVTPYAAGNTSVPAEWRSSLMSVNPGEPATDFSTFWVADANCYTYNQIIKVVDQVKPVIDNCPTTAANFNDLTANDSTLWNDIALVDLLHNTHDLCETEVDLSVTASDLCSGENVAASYLLFLDTNGDGVRETVINSLTPPTHGTVNLGNASNPNFAGGTSVRFDNRNVATNQRYCFTTQSTVTGGKKTTRLAWNTQAAPSTYVVPQLPAGRHKIKWVVTDGCGNESTCEYEFVVRDTKAPTVVCLNGVSINIMPTGMIDIWDTDMYQYISDNCTPANQMHTGICVGCNTFPRDSANNPIKAVLFNCSQLGTQIVRIWAQDKMGNADYCETALLVQDNAGNCTTINNKTLTGATKGTDKNGTIQGASDVTVKLNITATNSTPGGVHTFNTNNQGLYSFLNAVPIAADVTITPIKDIDHVNGVDMLDVLKVQRHILGLEPIDNPYRQVAADVNNSRSITASDIVEMRKLILGSYATLPAVSSWRFVEKSFQFPVAANAFSTVFPEMITIPNINDSKDNANFEAIKSGDVTGNAIYNSIQSVDDRTTATLFLDAQDQELVAGQTFTVAFKAATQADAAQFTLLLNGCNVKATDLQDQNFALHTGAMTVAQEKPTQFSVTFVATQAGKVSQMVRISDKITPAVAFAGTERQSVALRFNGIQVAEGFELMQNVPNPAKGTTKIGFTLPAAGTATLTFTNVEGRVLKTVKGNYAKGLNTVEIMVSELETGVLFYQLDTAGNTDVKKMIVIR
jgi:Secretion system C-terminal sorting domain